MKNMNINIEELRYLFKNGDLNECLEKMYTLSVNLKSKTLSNEILSEQGRMKKLTLKFNSGQLDNETHFIQEAKIGNRIIDLIERLEASTKPHRKKIDTIENTADNFDHKNLIGVWRCTHSSLNPNEIFFWSLLPNNLCIVNSFNKKTNKTEGGIFSWEYIQESQIIIQRGPNGETKGLIKWKSPLKFEVTVLNILGPIMIYDKLI